MDAIGKSASQPEQRQKKSIETYGLDEFINQ